MSSGVTSKKFSTNESSEILGGKRISAWSDEGREVEKRGRSVCGRDTYVKLTS